MIRAKKQANRSFARLAAVQALFEIEATRRSFQEVVAEFSERDLAVLIDDAAADAELDTKYMARLIEDAVFHQVKIDQLTDQCLVEKWKLKSVDPILRAIFRAGGAELIAGKTPYKVVINEFIEVSKAFDDDQQRTAFVNAVLNELYKGLGE